MIHILNGPNLGRLGKRQPDVYGATTLDDLTAVLAKDAADLGVDIVVRQTDSEAELLSWIHDIADKQEPVILNAGALTHTSVALRDACAELTDHAGFIEVHISNVYSRESFRHNSYLSDIAVGVIAGLGIDVYRLALRWFAQQDA
ncbi:MAG: type II 3-dehydroquinate dehydratase [Lawsonella sp.]